MSERHSTAVGVTALALAVLLAAQVQAAADGVSVRDLPDPMAPPKTAQPPPKAEGTAEPVKRVTYRLQGVKIEPRHRSAVINGQMVAVGDVIDGATVVSIESDGVVVQGGDEPITLKLLRNEVKQRSHVAR